MPYIGVSPFNGVRKKHTYTATASQTSFSGAGTEGITLSYKDSTFVDVYQNGVKLGEADYTSTSGTAIVLGTGASLNDLVEVVVYDVFSVADTVSKADGGTFDGNVTMGGTLGVTGNATVGGTLGVTGVLTGTSLDISGNIDVDGITNLDVVDIDGTLNVAGETTLQTHLNMGDGDIIKFGASADLQISHTGSFSKIADSGTGNLILACQDFSLTNPAVGENMITAAVDGAVTLYHNNVAKIATASTGVTSAGTYIGTAAGSASAPNFAITSGALGANGIFVPAANTLAFSNAGTERMRIDSGARLAFGNTDTNAKITVSQNGNALNLMRLQNTDGTDNARFIQFANDSNSDCGHIDQVNATTIAYNTTSDYRLKQNIAYTFDATTEVKKLKPCTFSWKHDDTDKSVYGFLAHEVSEIVSEAASGTKDATRDIGTIKSKDGDITAKNAPQAQANTDENETWEKTGTENVYQGYDAGKLVPLLVKTIQELEARIAALESA